MNDLGELLHSARDAIAHASGPIPERDLQHVHAVVRRARIQRHTVESFGAAAFAGVIGVGAWTAYGHGSREPVTPASTSPTSSPTSEPTPTPTPTPTPAPTPTSEGPVVRAAEIDDATLLQRLSAPRTGEKWTDPVRDDAAKQVLVAPVRRDVTTVYRVGTRGDATIYLAVDDATSNLEASSLFRVGAALYEIDAAGARLIACPSARTGDACLDSQWLVSGTAVAADEQTFYDSVTVPGSVQLAGGWTVSTVETRRSDNFVASGVPLRFGEAPVAELGDFGPLSFVVAPVAAGSYLTADWLASGQYAWRLPFGTYVVLAPEDVPGSAFDDITWDDGQVRTTGETNTGSTATVAPGVSNCWYGQTSIEQTHNPAEWRHGGTTADGLAVMIPRQGGTSLSSAIRQALEDHSSTILEGDLPAGDDGYRTGAAAGYPFPTDADFLSANALLAIQAPDGSWHLRLRADATNVVYECS